MALARLVVVAAVLLPHSAFAETSFESETGVLYQAELLGPTFFGNSSLSWLLLAEARSEFREKGTAGLGVGGELAIADGACKLLAAGAYAQIDPHRVSVEQWLSSCLVKALGDDITAPSLDLEHRLQYEVVPTLSSRRNVWARPYTRERFALLGSPLEGMDNGSRMALLPLAVEAEYLHQHVDGQDISRTMISVDLEIARCTPTGVRCIGPIPVDYFALPAMHVKVGFGGPVSSVSGGLRLFDVRGFHLGALAFEASFTLGAASLERDRADNGSRETIKSYFVPQGVAGVGGDHRDVAWNVRYRRDFYPTMDAQFAIDDRVTMTLRSSVLPGAKLEAFGARTALVDSIGQEVDLTGGVSLGYTRSLTRHLDVSLLGESGRSFYGSIENDATPRPTWVTRGLAVLSARLGNQPSP